MKLFLAILFVILSIPAFTQGLTVVAVGDATLEKDKIVFEQYQPNWNKYTPAQKKLSQNFNKLLGNDFSFYKKFFEVLSIKNNNQEVAKEPRFDYWVGKKASFLVRTQLSFTSKAILSYEVRAYDVSKGKKIFSEKGTTPISKYREVGHRITDKIYIQITGKESVFPTKIAFVSDRDSRGKRRIKELYLMDFDGHSVKRLTYHRGTVISPAFSYGTKYILYSLITAKVRKNRNVNLYMYDLATGKISLVSNRRGVNSGAVFMPDNEHIALTLSHVGNAEIFIMNLKSKALRRITKHYAVDVDPSISADGKLMSILSGRAGKAMIYTLDPSGTEKDVVRISYVGHYNATPRFSPDGKEIVFASWLNKSFDLFRISSDGTGLSRLTKNFGSNEDPTYSKDGQFIAFSSKRVRSRRKADESVYVMDRDGEILGNLTGKLGNCITPRWSK